MSPPTDTAPHSRYVVRVDGAFVFLHSINSVRRSHKVGGLFSLAIYHGHANVSPLVSRAFLQGSPALPPWIAGCRAFHDQGIMSIEEAISLIDKLVPENSPNSKDTSGLHQVNQALFALDPAASSTHAAEKLAAIKGFAKLYFSDTRSYPENRLSYLIRTNLSQLRKELT